MSASGESGENASGQRRGDGGAFDAALKEHQDLYRGTIETSPDGFCVVDLDGRFVEVNDTYVRRSGFTREQLLSMRVQEVEAPRAGPGLSARLERIARAGAARFETEHRNRSGVIWPVEISASFLPVQGGRVCAFMRDITDRRMAERALRSSTDELILAVSVFENSAEGITVTDREGKILQVNRSFSEITGYEPKEVLGQNPRLLKSGRHPRDFYLAMWASIQNRGSWTGEVWNRRRNGEVYPSWLTITAVRDRDGVVTHYVGMFSDITKRKESDEQIRHLAFYDPLTELPNRRLLRDRLEQALLSSERSGRHGAILFIDLDNFKVLNDTMGHDVGDLLLAEVARRLKGSVRRVDTVARLGGDEFVVMLESLSADRGRAIVAAEVVSEKARQVLNCPMDLDGRPYSISPSIGVSLFQGRTVGADELLKRADTAMYQAKAGGRNTTRFFDPAMQAAVEARAAMDVDLRHALDRNEFCLYLQRQFTRSGLLKGAEVLLRWIHPTRGLVGPAEFIPLCEETGLIVPIGEWVLREACLQLKRWEGDPRTNDLTLAANVSAVQFRQADFVDRVWDVLGETGARPRQLTLELTESLVLENVGDAIAKMREVRQAGVRFSLDDFGTGYSSLAYLSKLPLDQLKIDQSFVRDILSDRTNKVIAQTIIGMASTLGLNVMAEGVETEEQYRLLESLGCDAFQGFHFGRPVPVEEFLDPKREEAA